MFHDAFAMLDGCPIGIGNNRAGIEAMPAALPQAVAQGLDAAFRKSLVMHSGR